MPVLYNVPDIEVMYPKSEWMTSVKKHVPDPEVPVQMR
jgi:hypothetical protein